MNGAAEALLDELITINKEQADYLKNIAARAGSGPTGGGGGGGDAIKQGNMLTGVFGAMGRTVRVASDIVGGAFSVAMGLATTGFRGLTQAGNALWDNQMRLADGAIAGTNSLADLTAGLESLPFGLGLVAQAMTYQTKKLEANIATFQQLSDTGATLGGNLNEVRQSAKNMYLSMDEFVNVMKNNAPYLLYFGQTANDGARALVKFNSTMIQGSTGRALLGMGYSLEEANNMLGLYAATMGGVNAQQLGNQRQMEASVKSFATEMALSAELEGKSRKQKEDEMKERAAIAARENMLSKMNEQQRQAYLQAELAAGRAGGKAAQDALLSATLGLPPMTKAAQTWTAMAGDSAKSITGMVPAIQNASTDAANSQREIARLGAQASRESVEASQRFGRTMDVMSFRQGEVAETAQDMQRGEARARQQNLRTTEDYLNRENRAREQLTEAQNSQTGATVQAQGAVKHMGGLMDMLSAALEPLFPVITTLVKGFTEILPKVISFGGDVITKIIIPLFQDLFGGLTLDDVLGPFKDFFKGLFGSGEGATTMESVRKGLSDFLKPITTFIGDIVKAIDWQAVGSVFRTTFQTIGNVIKGLADIIGKIFGGDGGEFGKGLQDAFERFATIINRIVEVVQKIIDTASATPLFENMKKFFLKLFDVAFTIVEVVLSIIESPIGKFVFAVLGTVANTMFEMFNAVLDVVMGIVSIVEGIFDILSGDFSEGLGKIFGGLGDIIGGVVDFIGSILSGALSILGDAITYILFLIVEMGKGIIDWFSNLGTMIGNLLSAAWEGIVGAVTGMINAVINGFVAIKDGIVNFFNGGYETFLTDIWEGIKSIFSMVVDGVKNLAGDLWDKITSWGSDEEEPAPPPRPQPAPAQPRQPTRREAPRPQAREAAPPPASPAPELSAGAASVAEIARTFPPMTTPAGSGGATPDTATLNTNLQQMIRNLRDISDNTRRTADLIASNGNLFRR